MSARLTVKDLVERNKRLANSTSLEPMPFLSEMQSLGISAPGILIITCADPRCTPDKFLDLQIAEAVVIRNLCGHVAPAMENIFCVDYLLKFSEVMIVQHTDCGAFKVEDVTVRESLRKLSTENKEIDKMTFGGITNLEQSVKDDLAVFRKSPLLRKELRERVSGYVFDIKTGLLSSIEE